MIKSTIKGAVVFFTVLATSVLAGAKDAEGKSKIAKRKAPSPEPVYLMKSKVLTGKVRSIEKDGSSFVLNKMPVKLTSTTRFFRVYSTPLSKLREHESILIYGKTVSIQKFNEDQTLGYAAVRGGMYAKKIKITRLVGHMKVQGVVNGKAKTFIDMRPTQVAKREAREEAGEAARCNTARVKEVLGWHEGYVKSLSPLMFQANDMPQRVLASRNTAAINITKGNKEDLARRLYVIVVADEESSEETAEEAEEDESSTKRKSKRSRRRNKRSRKKKKEVQVSAKTIYIAKGSALLEFLLDPPQPVTKKTRTSTSDDEDDERDDYRSGTSRDQAIRRAKPSRPR